MKPRLSFVFMISLSAITILPMQSGCSDCTSANKGAELCDLLVKDYDVAFNDEVSQNPYYTIAYSVVNSILAVSCPDEVGDAGPHQNKLTLLYSDNPQFNNPEEMDAQSFSITQTTTPDGTYEFENTIDFTVDGYYVMDYSLDDAATIKERNESNNEGDTPVAPTHGRTKNYHFSRAQIFEVRGTGKASPRENNGKCFNSWTIKIKGQ